MKEGSLVIGADIGGSHITAAVIDLTNRQLMQSSLVRYPIDSHATATEIINSWGDCIQKAKGDRPIRKVCLAVPGPFSYEDGISLIHGQNKYASLYLLNVKKMLADVLGERPENIYLYNDAACFIQGEVFCGSMAGYEKAIGITLGTGLGTAIYENGTASSADLWNLPFKDGIAEDYLSSRWFIKRYFKARGKLISGVKDLIYLSKDDIVVQEIFDEFSSNLAQFLALFVEMKKPQAIVIGGNIANSFFLFRKNLVEKIQKTHAAVIIEPSTLGENAALWGAVMSACQMTNIDAQSR